MTDVSAAGFLDAIFFDYDAESETPVLGQTRQGPKPDQPIFDAYRLGDGNLEDMHHASLALQVPTMPRQTSRKANYTGGIGIVLDDVGEKVPAPDLEPTWIIETKPGSQQWGYLFDAPLRDQDKHNQLIKAIIDAGYSDPGMSGVVRWFRLPGSKPVGKAHAAQLVRFDPTRRFSPDDLLKRLAGKVAPKTNTPVAVYRDYDPHDVVFDWLEGNGLISKRGGDGWWEMQCPWSNLHSNDDRRAYYRPRGGPNARRGFNCFHSHPHSIYDFLAWVEKSGGPVVDLEDLPLWQNQPHWNEDSVSATLTDLELNDDTLASMLGAESWNEDARYVAAWKKWAFWNGGRWAVDTTLNHMTQTRAFLRGVAKRMIEDAQARGKGLTENEARKLTTKAKRASDKLRDKTTICAVEALARSNAASAADPDEFDADTMLLGTPGGTVDLRTGRVREARREDMITKHTAVTPAEPGAVPEQWLSFLHDIFDGDGEAIAFMQRAAGYALTGEVSEHKLLFLHGSGRNGKSVFLNTLFEIWGDYARKAPSATFLHSHNERHPTDVAGLNGARLVGSELPVGKTWNESVIKDLTGGDVMTARFMRGDFFDFKPRLTLMIAGNNQPSFRGVDEAIRSRVVLVPFKVTIPKEKRDPDLQMKLMQEAPAILRWAIDGAVAWRKSGLRVPASISVATEDYFEAEDIVGRFLADETVNEHGHFLSSGQVYAQFNSWCELEGLKPFAQRTLLKELHNRGYEKGKSGSSRGLKGLRLREKTRVEQYADELR